jgi:hypothetical protein
VDTCCSGICYSDDEEDYYCMNKSTTTTTSTSTSGEATDNTGPPYEWFHCAEA